MLKVIFGRNEALLKKLATRFQEKFPKADLAKWPPNEDGPTTHSAFYNETSSDNTRKRSKAESSTAGQGAKRPKHDKDHDLPTRDDELHRKVDDLSDKLQREVDVLSDKFTAVASTLAMETQVNALGNTVADIKQTVFSAGLRSYWRS